ncbi:MAG: hypothetical protein ACKV2V_21335, partial [Blastocatellia bacterium]
QHGHSGPIENVSFSIDGTLVLTAGADGEVILWETATGREIRRFSDEGLKDETPQFLTFAPGNTRLLVDHYLFDTGTGKKIAEIPGNFVGFSPGGRFLLTYDTQAVTVFQAVTGKQTRRIESQGGIRQAALSPDGLAVLIQTEKAPALLAVLTEIEPGPRKSGSLVRPGPTTTRRFAAGQAAFSPGGRYVVTVTETGTLLQDPRTGAEIRIVPGQAPCLSTDDKLILTVEEGGSVLREVVSGRRLRSFSGVAPAISPGGLRVVTETTNGPAVWDTATGQKLRQFYTGFDGTSEIVFNADGRFFLSLSTKTRDFQATVWDAGNLLPIRNFDADTLSMAVFSPDGRQVLTGHRDRVARLWDTATGAELRQFLGDHSMIMSMRASYDGRFLSFNSVTNSPEMTKSFSTHLWDLGKGREQQQHNALPDPVFTAAVSPDGTRVITGGLDEAHLWQAASGAEIRRLHGHQGRIWSASFSADGQMAVTAGQDSTVRLWDLAAGRELRRFTGHSAGVRAVALSSDGHHLLTAGNDGTARLWNVATGGELRQFIRHPQGSAITVISTAAFSPDGRRAVFGVIDVPDLNTSEKFEIRHAARVFDVASGSEIHGLEHEHGVISAGISPDGNFVLTGSADGLARVWDLQTGGLVRSFGSPSDPITAAMYAPDGLSILTGGVEISLPGKQNKGARACLRDARTGEIIKRLTGGAGANEGGLMTTMALAFSADGRRIISAGMFMDSREWARLLQAAARRGSEEEEVIREYVLANKVPSSQKNQRETPVVAQLWDTATGQPLRGFGQDGDEDREFRFSPDGRTVLAGARDFSRVRLLNPASGDELRRLEGSLGGINDLAFSPDGKLSAAAGHGVVYLWETATGREIRRLAGPSFARFTWKTPVTSLAFSASGREVMLLGDGAVYMADLTRAMTRPVMSAEQLGTLESAKGREIVLHCLAQAPNSTHYALGDANGLIFLIREIMTEPLIFNGHTGPVSTLLFTPDGQRLISAGKDQTVRIWEVQSGHQVQLIQHAGPVTAVALAPDGNVLVTASGTDLRLTRLDGTASPGQIQQTQLVTAAAFSGDGRWLVLGNEAGETIVMTAAGAEPRTWRTHAKAVTALSFLPGTTRLLSAGADGVIFLRDVTKDTEPQRLAGHTAEITALAVAPGGQTAISASPDRSVRVWDLVAGRETRQLSDLAQFSKSVSFSPDGRYLLIGNARVRFPPNHMEEPALSGGIARLYEAATGKRVRDFGNGATMQADFSADGKYVMTAAGDSPGELKKIQVWDIETGREVKEVEFEEPYTLAATLSPNGKQVLIGSQFDDPPIGMGNDYEATLLDVASGKVVYKLQGHTAPVSGVSFLAAGRYLATGGADGAIVVWHADSGKQLCRLFSFPDGTTVVVDNEGRFDTNNLEELRWLHWVFPDEPLRPLSLEIFMRDYYEPRLLTRLLNGEKLPPVRSQAALNRLQPAVRIVGVRPQAGQEDRVSVTVEVTETKDARAHGRFPGGNRSGAYDLRLFRNGQMVAQSARPVLDSARTSAAATNLPLWRGENQIRVDPVTGRATLQFDNIRLPRRTDGDPVLFTAYAFNADRVKSADAASFTYVPAPVRERTPRRAYVITMGVSAAQDPAWDLWFAAPGAREIGALVRAKLEQAGQFDEIISVPLLSDYEAGGAGLAEKTATRENLEATLALLAGRPVTPARRAAIPNQQRLRPVTPDDLVLLYIASHGYADPQGTFYVVPYNIGDAAGISVGLLRSCQTGTDNQAQCAEARAFLRRCISSAELTSWMKGLDAGEMTLILDSCHSTAVAGPGFKPGPMGDRGFGQLSYDKGMRILTATQSDNVA